MRKAVNLYFSIWSMSADYIVNTMEEAEGDTFTLRINSPGGDVFAGYGIAMKMREMEAKVVAKVDGMAASMAALLLLFADEVQMGTQARIMIHRADGRVENDDQQAFLDGINKDLKGALKAKIDSKKLKELKGVTIEQIFNPSQRIDVWLTAKEAKAIGLVDKVIALKPEKISALENFMPSIAAMGYNVPEIIQEPTEETTAEATEPPAEQIQTNNEAMTAEDFKKNHPEAYQAIAAAAAKAELDRVKAWLAFVEVDAEAVQKGIESGEPIGQAEYADFMAKIAKATATANLAAEGAATEGATDTGEVEGTPAVEATEKAVESFAADVRKYLPQAEKKED